MYQKKIYSPIVSLLFYFILFLFDKSLHQNHVQIGRHFLSSREIAEMKDVMMHGYKRKLSGSI